jgi:hypothetical protein
MKPPLGASEVLAFHKTLSNWGRFGERDQLGTLNLITPEKRAAAARLVTKGRTVSAARSLPTVPSPENPSPVQHHMIGTCTEAGAATGSGSRRTASRPLTSTRSVTSSTKGSSTTATRSSA